MTRVLSALVNGGVLGCLLTFAVWVVLRVVPRRALNAATRYAVWWATLAIVIGLPVVYWTPATASRVAPLPHGRGLQDNFSVSSSGDVRDSPSAARASSGEERTTLAFGRNTPRSLTASRRGDGAVAATSAVTSPRADREAGPTFPIQITAELWPRWLFAVWALASFWLLARLAVSCMLLHRISARAFDIQVTDGVALRRKIRLAGSTEIATPVAVGPRRPSVLIPAGLLSELETTELKQIVVHEAGHLARYDDYALIVQRIVEALLALHPVVRWIARRIDLEREIACDDLVLAATGAPRSYATCLTRIVELSGHVRPSLAAAGAANDASHLSRRVTMLLDRGRHTGTRLLKARLAAIVAMIAVAAWIGGRATGFVAFAAPLVQTIRQVPVRFFPRPVLLSPTPAPAQDFEGRVIDDSSGNPVASAELRFHKAGMRELAADLDSDREGHVRATGLGPGDYTVDVCKPNYVTASMKFKVPGEGLTVRLVRYAVISGQVIDQQGLPVPGQIYAPYGRTIGSARIAVLARAEGSEQLRTVREQFVADGGKYRVYDLPPGEYAIGLWYDGLKDGSGVQLYPNNAHPRFFTVAGGEDYRNVDFLLLPQGAYRVSGRVEVKKKGDNYSLALGLPDQPALPIAQTITEDGGTFHFDRVPPGVYDLLAGGPDRGYGARSSLMGPEPYFGRMKVTVSGDVENLNVALNAGRSVAVTLRAHGSDTLPKGCPQSVAVTAELLEPWGLVFTGNGTQVAFGKEQTVKNLPPGRIRLLAGDLGDGCYQVNQTVADLSGENPTPMVLELASAGAIRGTLQAGAARAADFAVVLLPPGAAPDAQAQVAFPDAQGRFTLEGLPPGRYRITAQPVSAPKTRWVSDVSRMMDVDVRGGASTDIELPVVPKGDRQ